MFNLFFRRYVPGFRVGPDGVPGFNIDDNGLPQRASASSDGTLPDSAAHGIPTRRKHRVRPASASVCQEPRAGSYRLR